MAKQALAREIDLEPIDRLEEKIKLLVGMITRLRSEQARVSEENVRLSQEIGMLRAQLADSEGTNAEMTMLRDEREIIRSRVQDMLEQLEHLSL